ncbi:MAG TPA: zinc ribbon domain-containing protein [Symbiobacteriaceae bacterium]|nr:zinc ribbon domain-containing protein [Symbiobacteriaceae bacterium]
MSVKCQNCGSIQPGGKFCPSCGGQMMPVPEAPVQQQPAAANMPQPPYPPQPFPPQPPKAAGGKGWVLWAAIGGGVVVLGAILAFVLLRDKPTPPPAPTKPVQTDPAKPADPTKPAEPAKPATPAPSAPTKSVGGTGLKLISQGSFGARPNAMVATGSYLGYGTGEAAAFYKVDAKGQPKELARLEVKDVGDLKGIAVGQPYNDGRNIMFALYEYKLFIVGEQGGVISELDVDGVDNVLVGDYDGDGKTETIFLGLDANGDYGFEVWRYPDKSYVYKKEGRQDPWPELFQTEMKAGKTSLIMGYTFEGNDLYLLLYKWDGVGGPAVIGKYPIANAAEAPAEWIASGPSGLGPTLAVARGGAKPDVEVLTVSSDAKSAKSVGRFAPDGAGRSAVLTGNFTGQGSQMLTVDESGKWYLYDIAK